MPIHRLVQNHAFGPDVIALMVTAFEDALREAQIIDRADPEADLIAKKIIEFAQQGERDPNRLRDRALLFVSANRPPHTMGH